MAAIAGHRPAKAEGAADAVGVADGEGVAMGTGDGVRVDAATDAIGLADGASDAGGGTDPVHATRRTRQTRTCLTGGTAYLRGAEREGFVVASLRDRYGVFTHYEPRAR